MRLDIIVQCIQTMYMLLMQTMGLIIPPSSETIITTDGIQDSQLDTLGGILILAGLLDTTLVGDITPAGVMGLEIQGLVPVGDMVASIAIVGMGMVGTDLTAGTMGTTDLIMEEEAITEVTMMDIITVLLTLQEDLQILGFAIKQVLL